MNYFSRSFLIAFGFLSAVALAAAGDRFINNPNQDKDVIIQVNDGGVTKPVITAKGDTGELIVGTTTVSTVKANGTNTDLTLEAVGSGGALVVKTNGTEKARINQLGQFLLSETSLSIYSLKMRAGNTGTIVSGGTFDITVDAQFAGLISTACNNAGNGNVQTQKITAVGFSGGSGGPSPTTISTGNGAGGQCAHTVTVPSAGVIRITNSSACTGASSMRCSWFALVQQTD